MGTPLPAHKHLQMRPNNTFRDFYKIRRNGVYLNLDGCTVTAKLKRTNQSETVLLDIFDSLVTEDNESVIGLHASAAETLALPAGMVWELKVVHLDGDERTYLAGPVSNDYSSPTPPPVY